MFITRMLRPRVVGTLALMGVIGTAGFGFAATNTVSTEDLVRAGSGLQGISGYTVSDVIYTTTQTAPGSITDVAFTLDETASTVKVGLTTTPGTLYDCDVVGLPADNDWTCEITGGVLVSAANTLTVVAHASDES